MSRLLSTSFMNLGLMVSFQKIIFINFDDKKVQEHIGFPY